MYTSGIELPRVQFSLLDYAKIESGSYFIGFDLDNSGKLSKMDNSGEITVIESEPASSAHYIGEEYGGGIVFHVYKDELGEEHGLICSIVDQAFDASYSNVEYTLIGTTTYWDGQTNTNLMLSQEGASTGAWKNCTDYSYGGFTDWYLPSIDELGLLRTNTFNSNKTLSTIVGAQLLSRHYYWSSTEESSTTAWTYNFLTGETAPLNKFYPFWVRAIRKF